jgi:hypothetical protein
MAKDRSLTRAAQKHTCVFAASYRAATGGSGQRDDFFSILLVQKKSGLCPQ